MFEKKKETGQNTALEEIFFYQLQTKAEQSRQSRRQQEEDDSRGSVSEVFLEAIGLQE